MQNCGHCHALSVGDERHIWTMCFHSTRWPEDVSKIPSTSPSVCHQAESHQPAWRFVSNQIFYFPCQAAAISHFSSDLYGPNVGIHYHTRTLCGFALFFLRPCHGSTVDASGAPSTVFRLCCPCPGSSSALVLFTVVKRHSLSVSAQSKRQ